MPAVARFCYPDFEHNPACLPEVPQHVDAMVKGEVCGRKAVQGSGTAVLSIGRPQILKCLTVLLLSY
jgi:hypothetical protein